MIDVRSLHEAVGRFPFLLRKAAALTEQFVLGSPAWWGHAGFLLRENDNFYLDYIRGEYRRIIAEKARRGC